MLLRYAGISGLRKERGPGRRGHQLEVNGVRATKPPTPIQTERLSQSTELVLVLRVDGLDVEGQPVFMRRGSGRRRRQPRAAARVIELFLLDASAPGRRDDRGPPELLGQVDEKFNPVFDHNALVICIDVCRFVQCSTRTSSPGMRIP